MFSPPHAEAWPGVLEAANDLVQPLHAVDLYLNALDRRVSDGEARDILAKAQQANQAATRMLVDLHEFARLQVGPLDIRPDKFLLSEMFDSLRQEHPALRIAVAGDIWVSANRTMLERALLCLVVNAATHGGGAPEIAWRQAGAMIEIAVSDQGPGIAASERERLFAPFVRLGAQRGLGLGLAIAARIALLLGGTLRLETPEAGGARFILAAPAA